MNTLRNNPTLAPSMGGDISDALLEQLLDTKDLIEKRKREGHTVALVHLSGDLMHSSHIQYMNTIRAKLQQRLQLDDKNIKLIVGVEADSRTIQRKKKENINKEDERVYGFGNLKAVDHAFVEFEGVTGEMENEERPVGVVKYLDPDIMVSHQEHIDNFKDYLGLYRRLKQNNENSKCLVINYGDVEKYLGEDEVRSKYNRTTTKTIQQIFDLYRDNPKYNKKPLSKGSNNAMRDPVADVEYKSISIEEKMRKTSYDYMKQNELVTDEVGNAYRSVNAYPHSNRGSMQDILRIKDGHKLSPTELAYMSNSGHTCIRHRTSERSIVDREHWHIISKALGEMPRLGMDMSLYTQSQIDWMVGIINMCQNATIVVKSNKVYFIDAPVDTIPLQ